MTEDEAKIGAAGPEATGVSVWAFENELENSLGQQ